MTDNHSTRRFRALQGGVSLCALIAFGLAPAANAQTADAAVQSEQGSTGGEGDAAQDSGPDIVVVGVRAALDTSQNIKKNSDTFVDSITATDIGAFPDKSAAEALQRVPGITVSRLQSADDSTHPSGEPTGVLIRGLTQVRTEFNGRDSFSADSARGLQFNDVSPELLAGVDAYKNQTAEMIEGGIAGTVNLRTRLPFDQKGLLVTGNFRMNYGDRSDRWTPEFSGLISKVFETPIGRFGLLASYAESKVVTRTESVIMDKIDTYCTTGFGTAAAGTVNSDGSVACATNPFGGTGFRYAPDGIRYSEVDYDRKRRGIALAAQYENNSGSVRATLQYVDSHYRNAWFERASHTILEGNYFGTPAFNPRTSTTLGPADGTGALVFGSNGMLQSGVLTQGHGSFSGTWESTQAAINAGSAIPGVPFVNNCAAPSICTTLRDGLYLQNEARNFGHREGTRDFSGNLKWDVSDQLHANFDVQYIDASTYNNDILVAAGSMANFQYSTNKDGTPQVALLPGSNVNYASGGLANPHNYWIPFIQGHVEDNDANELALRGDLEYEFGDGGWFDSIKAGVRYADRKQNVRYSTFNWTPIAANWNCNGPGFNADNTTGGAYPTNSGNCAGNAGHPDFKGYGAGIWESYSMGELYDGNVFPNGPLVFLNRDTLRDFNKLIGALGGAATNSPIGSGYTAICDRAEATVDDCFTPGEVLKVREQTEAAYLMLRFGGDDKTIGGVSVVGNVGVRVVRTRETSDGSIAFPAANIFDNLPACGTPLSGNSIVNPSCYLTPTVRAFANGGFTPDTYKASSTEWLPSFNVRFGLDDKSFIRFAYSRAMSRPDIGFLRNTVAINAPILNTTPDSPYIVYNSPTAAHTAANVTGYNFVFQANAGNAALKPITADQFDLSFEHYMGRSSSITLTGFYKKLNNSISFGQFARTFTNNGSSQTVQILGPANSGEGGKLMGVEAGFQTFFDFLPGPLSGLGTQLNYTYVHQSDITNSNLLNASSSANVGAVGAGQPALGGAGSVIDSHQLAGISKHTFNAVALYEKGPVGFRLAYNWRSRYLTQNLDCCIGLPVFQKAAGYLDGSLRLSVNRFLELSVDASNLLNTKSVYQQQIFGDSPATPGARPVYLDSAWSRVDRRFQFGARFKF
ncbi:TonB-dependent receptor [Sphingomonas psychrotolerans]|uniref:TonB-dependent receptor n=1 Tax=Sphingomonas psychrotolerans TaxID=1327635 RepID=A0ABU3MZF6_9SPHN|nr:TonB-dependent receptor [Sphingomonas psychrotolerans]MDT8757677.1 TonB-dependent receptor [Sphingomonas psychrotolerans]